MMHWSKLIIVSLILNLGGLVIGHPAKATDIGGAIFGTLLLSDSPYIVTTDLSVPSSQTLTIEPGVILKFNSTVAFFIDGTLIAEGTATDSIYFTSNNSSPDFGDWNGIVFRNTGDGSMKYTIVEYAATGVKSSSVSPTIASSHIRFNNNGLDCFVSSSPIIRSNKIEENRNSAIRCNASSPTITKNEIYVNSTNSIDSAILCDASSPRISENVFYGNGNSAIDCINNSAPEIWQNTIAQNDFGITTTDSSPSVKNNIIVNNWIGIISDNSSPIIGYNDVWSNTGGNFLGTPAGVGDLTTTNANGTPSDTLFNIISDPLFIDAQNKDYNLQSNSPCVDAGDPSNPAGIIVSGLTPDIGAFEQGVTVPVELMSFNFVDGVLKWTTASETNNFGFEIQRSNSENNEFIKIGFVPGAGTTVIPQHYGFRDKVETGTYYYRLKQIDTDGSFELSPIVKAVYSPPSSIFLAQNYPNPFNPSTTISFQIPYSNQTESMPRVTLTIFNSLGQEVLVLLDERKSPGSYKLPWKGVDKLGRPVSSGLYIYRLKYGNEMLTRRMILSR